MKTFFAIATLVALLQHSTSASAADTDVKSEFLRWKASDAGQLAYKNGFVPSRSGGSSSSKVSVLSADEPTQDELTRFQNSLDAVARIQARQPHATFSVDTPFALMTSAEFAAHVDKSGVQQHLKDMERQISPRSAFTGATDSANVVNASVAASTAASSAAATTTTFTTTNNASRKLDTWVVNVDWQTKGCVTRIKDQGSCGVCWAFAATAALESGYCARTGVLYELSEQEIVSCSRDTASCNGWWSGYTYDWLTRLNGGSICTEASYPYVSGGGTAPSCKRYEYNPSFNCKRPNLGAYFYGGGYFADHTQLEAAVLKQPVAMSIAAYGSAFQYYQGGVLMGDEQNCPVDKINHEITIVGFGTLNGIPYWKIKNHWTSSWGSGGYMYIERGYQGHMYGACGVEKYGFYPIFPSTSDPGLNKRTTTPEWYTLYEGTSLTVLTGIWEAEQCADRCTQNPSCVAFNWFGETYWCELKSTITKKVSGSGWSGSVISKAESLKKCAPISSNTDFPGNDLRATVAASADECCDHCDAVNECNAFTWSKYNGGMCYLKTQGPGKPLAASPDSDGTPFVKSGVTYKCQALQANTDRPGYDLGNAPSSTAANCCGVCRSTADCYSFSWTDFNGGTCWLKKWGSTTAAATGVTSGIIL